MMICSQNYINKIYIFENNILRLVYILIYNSLYKGDFLDTKFLL